MSSKDKIKATAKNIEEKAQKALKNFIGSNSEEDTGKAKQVKIYAQNVIEDGKNAVKDAIN